MHTPSHLRIKQTSLTYEGIEANVCCYVELREPSQMRRTSGTRRLSFVPAFPGNDLRARIIHAA